MMWCVLGALALAGAAQEPAPVIQTQLDTAVVTVGDRLRFTVSVTHGAGERVRWPDSLDLGPFEVLDAQVPAPQQTVDRVTSSLVLTLTAFQLGELEIPRFNVVVERPGEPAVLSTDGWAVTVESVGLDEGGDIRDVKGPVAMPRNWLLVVPWVVALVALVAAGFWTYRRVRSQAVHKVVAPARPPRPAHEVAYEALAALERSSLLRRGEVKEYYIQVSDIFRTYVEGRYGVPALEMASAELLDALRRLGLSHGTRLDVQQFLEYADLVKFAKYRPAPGICRDAVPVARRLVDATRPQAQLADATVA